MIDLDELQKLCVAASPQPWGSEHRVDDEWTIRCANERVIAHDFDKRDADLAAAAVNAMPDLIAKARAFDRIAAAVGLTGRPCELVVGAVERREGSRGECVRLRAELALADAVVAASRRVKLIVTAESITARLEGTDELDAATAAYDAKRCR